MAEASHSNGMWPVMAIDRLPSGNISLLHPDFTQPWAGYARLPVLQGFYSFFRLPSKQPVVCSNHTGGVTRKAWL